MRVRGESSFRDYIGVKMGAKAVLEFSTLRMQLE
jgi:hypothetical protein